MIILRSYQRLMALVCLLIFSISTIGFSIDLHYCGGHLKSISLIGKAKSCHEMAATKSCHMTKTTAKECSSQVDADDCCNNSSSYSLMDYDGHVDITINGETIGTALIAQSPSLLTPSYSQNIFHVATYAQPPPISGAALRVRLGSFIC